MGHPEFTVGKIPQVGTLSAKLQFLHRFLAFLQLLYWTREGSFGCLLGATGLPYFLVRQCI